MKYDIVGKSVKFIIEFLFRDITWQPLSQGSYTEQSAREMIASESKKHPTLKLRIVREETIRSVVE